MIEASKGGCGKQESITHHAKGLGSIPSQNREAIRLAGQLVFLPN